MTTAAPSHTDNPVKGILFIVLGMTAISVNDMLIKQLSGDYPLHQMIFVRSAIGIAFSVVFLQLEGGFAALKTDRPWAHLMRGLLLVVANMAYFTALAVMPLANATALFFVAPLFITLLSIPLLGETVGARRISAVVVGFAGVIVMLAPWEQAQGAATGLVLLLPVLSAFTYALMQMLTRRLGVTSQASAMAIYIQGTFLIVSAVFWVIAGDGRYAEGVEHPSLRFLLTAWRWPEGGDVVLFLLLGCVAAVVGYSMSQAYRSAPAATVAPFEYVALPMAILWGWMIWGELPNAQAFGGIALIVGAGLYVFLREGVLKRAVATRRPIRRY